MSEVKHTPGPWKVVDDTCGCIRVTDSGSVMVAAAYLRTPSSEEMPNARLIAASPDLLEGAELAAEFVRYTLEFFDWTRFPNLHEGARMLAEELAKAIAKAKGV